MINPILNNILTISLSCSGIAVLLLVVRKVIGKNTGAWWRSMLWVMLLVRLVIPVIIESPIGIINREITPLPVNDYAEYENVSTDNNIPEAYAVDSHSIENTVTTGESTQSNSPANNAMDNPNSFSPISLINPLYLLGLVVSVLVLLVRIIILNIKVNRLTECNDKRVVSIFTQVRRRLGIKRRIKIVLEDIDSVPALCGLIMPVVILPKSAVQKSSDTELEYIFIHELTHYKRGDIFKLWLLETAVCVHWFNPLFHLIKSVIVQDIELACDERVLSNIHSKEYVNYGNVLVNCSTRNRTKHPLVVTSNFAGKRGSKLKERLVMIKKFNRPRIITTGIVLVLLISVVLVACSTSVEKDEIQFANAEISVSYLGEDNVFADSVNGETREMLIEMLNEEKTIEETLDFYELRKQIEFLYVIYDNDIRYEMFRTESIPTNIYLAEETEEKSVKLYYYGSSKLGDVMDDIESDYIKEHEITRYDDMVLDIIVNLIDGNVNIDEVVNATDEWTNEGNNSYTTRMYLYNDITVIFDVMTGDITISRALDYDVDTLTVDYLQKGEKLVNPSADEIKAFLFDKAGAPDDVAELTKDEIINKLELKELRNFSCGLAAAKDKNNKYGYVDIYGDWVVEPIYSNVHDFVDNMGCVGLYEGEVQDENDIMNTANKWGYVNNHGQLIKEAIYDRCTDFENGYGYIYSQATNVGEYIDYAGNTVLSSQQLPDELSDFWMGNPISADGTTIVEKSIEKEGDRTVYQSLIDLEGNVLIDGEKLNICCLGNVTYGYRVAETNERTKGSANTGVLDGSGQWIVEPLYDTAAFMDEEKLVLNMVTNGGLAGGVYNIKTGQWEIEPSDKAIFDFGYDMIVFYTMSEPQKMELYSSDYEKLLDGKSYHYIEILAEDLVKTAEKDGEPAMLTWSDGTRFVTDYGAEYARYITDDVFAVYYYDYDQRAYYMGIMVSYGRQDWLVEPKYNRLISFDGSICQAIVIDYEKSESGRDGNRNIVYYVETFDLDGNVLSTGQEMNMSYDELNEVYPFLWE